MTDQPSWHDDTPATDEQIETIRRDLDGGPGVGGAAFSRHAVRKLLAAYDEVRLSLTVQMATNKVLEARAKKAETDAARCQATNESDLYGVIRCDKPRDHDDYHEAQTDEAYSRWIRTEMASARKLSDAVERAKRAEKELAELRGRIGKGETPDSHCPWCGMAMWLDTDGLAPLHDHPINGGRCPGVGRRPSDEWRNGEWKAGNDDA